MDFKKEKCEHCGGTGTQLKQKGIGPALRHSRIKTGVSLRSLAEALNVSAPYLSDLEKDRRNWTLERIEMYQSKLVILAKKK
jgi:predicted transcriptional regulator